MKNLNVIDLDGTLTPFDTFRRLVLSHWNARLLCVIALRKVRILSRSRTSMLLTRCLSDVLSDEARMQHFAEKIVAQSRADVIEKVRAQSTINTLNLLLSASPNEYVKHVADQLGFEGIGSHWCNGRYIHCYGPNKLKLIQHRYPRSAYHYHYMISDSESDLVVMRTFDEYELI